MILTYFKLVWLLLSISHMFMFNLKFSFTISKEEKYDENEKKHE